VRSSGRSGRWLFGRFKATAGVRAIGKVFAFSGNTAFGPARTSMTSSLGKPFRKTAVAFPSEKRADGALTEAAYRQMFTKLTADHLAYNRLSGAGIPGVEAFGPYNVRHLKASHVLKLTQSFEKAGAAIQDTADTARRHYAKWGPSDANRAIEDINSRLRGVAEDDVPSEDADEGT
jgi:hypothetical protein